MSKEKYIVATSGGFVTTKRWGVMRPGATFLKALELTKKDVFGNYLVFQGRQKY